MEIEFRNLSYTVQTYFRYGGKKKTVLKNINGKFLPGQLCAIMGPSGAGKTTLLHALSGYRTWGVSGDLLVDGSIRDEAWFRRVSCYLTQEDQLPLFMSVHEAMMMAAHLRLPRALSRAKKEEIILTILAQLGLVDTQNTKVQLLSGGERRRLSVALELLDNPPVFFLDEPISGLDDVAAKQTMKLLRRLAAEGCTVITTVHQPSALLLQLFHRVYIVARGRCVFQGTPQALVPFLNSAGFFCPTSYNPADYIMELVDLDKENNNLSILCSVIQNGSKCEDSYESPKEADISKKMLIKKDSLLNSCAWIKLKELPKDGKIHFVNPSWYQFIILFERTFKESLRNKKALFFQTFHYITCALLIGLVFLGNGDDGAIMFNHLKFWVGVVIFFTHTRLFIPITLLPSEVKIAKKEHFNRWYSLGAYYMAMTLGHLPLHLLLNAVYITIVYYLSGLPRDMFRFWTCMLIANSVSLCTEGIGIAIGVTFNTLKGSVVGPCVTGPFLGLAIYGFDFAKQISTLMRLAMRTSPMRCGLAAFVIITFGYGRERLECHDFYCHFSDPKVLLEYLDGSDNQIYTEMAALIASIILYRFLAYLSLRKRFAT